MTNSLYEFALSSSFKTRFCVLCCWRFFFPFFQTVHHLASQFWPPGALLSYVGFAQFRKFDLKFETEIIIRLKYWNFSFWGKFFFFLPFSHWYKTRLCKISEEILENIAIATTTPKSQVLTDTQGHSELTRTWRLRHIKNSAIPNLKQVKSWNFQTVTWIIVSIMLQITFNLLINSSHLVSLKSTARFRLLDR